MRLSLSCVLRNTCFYITSHIFMLFLRSIVSSFLAPKSLAESFPGLGHFFDTSLIGSAFASLLTGVAWTLFFSVCPYIFKSIANYGSGATSVRQAEYFALQYYWFFMLLTAFTGTSLTSMVINGLVSGFNLGQQAQVVLLNVAAVIPTQVSATWLSWIIVRFTITLPLYYLFQINTFLFSILGMKCCARMMQGG